jgi:hypothetical protein
MSFKEGGLVKTREFASYPDQIAVLVSRVSRKVVEDFVYTNGGERLLVPNEVSWWSLDRDIKWAHGWFPFAYERCIQPIVEAEKCAA